MRLFYHTAAVLLCASIAASHAEEDLRSVSLQASVSEVQPMTGIVLWSTNPQAATAPIQLEFCYLTYAQVVDGDGNYDWAVVDELLTEVASRKHQLVLRWHDTYVGKPSGVPDSIRQLVDYSETKAESEGKPTVFPDWSRPELEEFVLEFFSRFAERYDRDRRLAFVQVGFGLWAEYHIYDGPMTLGGTFPRKIFQARFLQHLRRTFRETPWMVSVDAAGEHTPLARSKSLRSLPFGVFDDSFNHARHAEENEPNWKLLGMNRWRRAPAGGEFSFFEDRDQAEALAPNGPHGVLFERQAAKFHVSFIVGDAQPRFQSAERVREAGMACGYRFRVTRFEASPTRSEVVVENTGIAPIYYNAFPAVDGVRSESSLKGLLPGKSRTFRIACGGENPGLSVECDRLVDGQRIGYEADLP